MPFEITLLDAILKGVCQLSHKFDSVSNGITVLLLACYLCVVAAVAPSKRSGFYTLGDIVFVLKGIDGDLHQWFAVVCRWKPSSTDIELN